MKNIIIFSILLALLATSGCSTAVQALKGNQSLSFTEPVRLSPCPNKPNCINTEYSDDKTHYQQPIAYKEKNADQILLAAKQIIINLGGKIVQEDSHYLHAEFTSLIFRFVDDFEIRIDKLTHLLHIRSASRLGYTDFGVNQRRVEKFSQALKLLNL